MASRESIVPSPSLDLIGDFLSVKRLALVGVSHDARDFSRVMLRELIAHGYDVVPVNRAGGEVEGRVAYTQLGAIPGGVEAALVMVRASEAASVVRACAEAGIRRVWLHRGAGPGAVSVEAVAVAEHAGLDLVAGECPLMYLEPSAAVHRAHGAFRILRGRWPAPVPVRRSGLSWALIALLALTALGALGGGLALLLDPSGALLGATPALIAGSPFSTFLVPGLVLVALGIGHSIGVVMTAGRRPQHGLVAVVLGVMLVGFIAFELAWLAETSWLQVLFGVVGLAEIALGTLASRAVLVSAPRPCIHHATTA